VCEDNKNVWLIECYPVVHILPKLFFAKPAAQLDKCEKVLQHKNAIKLGTFHLAI
jgi:hypothetical protein